MAPREKQPFLWGLAASIVFHALLLLAFPLLHDAAGRRFPEPRSMVIARLVIEPEAESAPQTPAKDESPPQETKPPPKPATAIRPKPKPLPKLARRAEQAPAPAEPVPPQPPAPPSASATAPDPAAPAARAEAAGKSDPLAQSAPAAPARHEDNPDLALLIGQFRIGLMREVSRDLKPQYQRLARRQDALGDGEIVLVVGESGAIAELQLARSTGYAVLDKLTLDSIRKSKEAVPIPPGLHGRRFSVRITVRFRLDDE